ncbi:MAG TPA: hypothetical protein VMW91_06075 [Desulfosporosinus sp.]|nr:hypothetical protein [Desulfosporosinus sp.]
MNCPSESTERGIAEVSAEAKAVRNALGLVQVSNRTFEIRASPWMARCRDGLMSRCHGRQGATTCRKPRGLRFSFSDKRIAMERVRTGQETDSLFNN